VFLPIEGGFKVFMKVRAHVFVSGRVQGVFFRHETRREARMRGVKGWVRNLPDGRVEAVFEGEEEAVKELIEFCKTWTTGREGFKRRG